MTYYVAVFFLTGYLSIFYDFWARHRVVRYFLSLLLFLVLGGFSGLRGVDVGTDTSSYYEIFEYLSNSGINSFFLGYEPGYVVINLFSHRLGLGPQGSILISSLVVAFLVVLAAARFSVNSFVFFAVYLGLSFYIFSFNGIRQALAVAVILNGAAAFSEGKVKNSAVWCFLAMLFHVSAAVAFILVLFRKVRFGKDFWLVIWFFSLFFMFFSSPLKNGIMFFSSYLPPRLQDYLGANLFEIAGTVALRDVFYQLMAIVSFMFWNKGVTPFYRFLSMSVILAVVFKNVLFDFGFIGRLSLYFEIFIPIYFGYLFYIIDRCYGRWVLSFTTFFLMFMLYYRAILGNSNGVFPYYTVNVFG